MVDPLLVVGIVILIIILLVANVYCLIYWQHPEDKNESILLKILIVVCLQISEMAILLLPVDVANNGGDVACDHDRASYCGDLDMRSFWISIFSLIAFCLIVCIPFATFYYDANDGTEATQKCTSRFCSATLWEIVVVAITLLVLLSAYFTAGETNIPITVYKSDLSNVISYNRTVFASTIPSESVNLVLNTTDLQQITQQSAAKLSYPVDFPIYIVGLVGWVGWWLFVFFCGTGLAALPYDFIIGFVRRPNPLSPDELAKMQIGLQKKTADLIDLATMMRQERREFLRSGASAKEKAARHATDQIEFNQLSRMVYTLDLENKHLQACKVVQDNFNPLIPYAQLVAGVVCLGLSSIWFVHIVLYILVQPAYNPVLNDFFAWFDLWFPMFGTLFYGIFAMYLYLCTVKGCFKLGMKFLCVKIHPMEMGATYINAFLFNVAILMLCTFPTVQFCAIAFSGYAQYTDLVQLFNFQIRYLHFFSNFYVHHVFIYILFITVPISLLWMICTPKERLEEESAKLKLEVMRKASAV